MLPLYSSSILQPFYRAFIEDDRYLAFISGLKATIQISFFAVILGICIGLVVAVCKTAADRSRGMRIIGKICNIYTTVIRGTPVYLQLLIFYNVIFVSPNASAIFVATLCFGINSGAYVAEIIRGGIEAVDAGQMEAGRSLGLNYLQTMRYIIVPQAVKSILPALGNEFIILVKDSSLAGVIAVTDLTKAASYIGSVTYDMMPPLFIAAAVYLIIVMGLTKLQGMLERRLAQGDHH